ncbi:MAG: SCO family protein [candidate division NC10 bacterium]|nr:SCO family protein [candidate division NC10 bacterium]
MPMPLRRRLPLLTLLAALTMGHSSPAQTPAKAPASTPLPFAAEEVGIDEKLSQRAALDLPLKDEDGKAVPLRALIDKPTILTLVYFRCTDLCSLLLHGVVDVLNRTQSEPGKDFQVITVSFDPRDTPEIAAEKRASYLREITRPFPPAAWRFLTADAATTTALADSVGFKFKRRGEDFIHAAAIIFLSPTGEVTRYMYGTAYLPADLQMAVQEARPTINKWLKICFSYDPVGRTYVLSFTKIGATIILLGAAIFLIVLVRAGRRRNRQAEERA